MTKTYTYENVTYGAKGRRWEFSTPNYNYATSGIVGGRVTADKVARIIHGAIKRTAGSVMDNLGRANINTIFHKAKQKHIKVHKKNMGL